MVSPWKTGLGNSTFSKPRLPTVVPSVVSPTEIPTAMPSVGRLLTSGLPNSALAAAWKSMCSGCGFMVSVEKNTLSASVIVRPISWRKTSPTLSSSKCLPAIAGLLARDGISSCTTPHQEAPRDLRVPRLLRRARQDARHPEALRRPHDEAVRQARHQGRRLLGVGDRPVERARLHLRVQRPRAPHEGVGLVPGRPRLAGRPQGLRGQRAAAGEIRQQDLEGHVVLAAAIARRARL